MSISETYAGNIIVVEGPFEYNAMCSGALAQGRVVELNTTVVGLKENVPCVGLAVVNSAVPIGYVDSDWDSGDLCVVYTGGIARLEDSGSGISAGAKVMCAASGKIKTYASGTLGAIVGVALEAISSSTFGQVLVNISYMADIA